MLREAALLGCLTTVTCPQCSAGQNTGAFDGVVHPLYVAFYALQMHLLLLQRRLNAILAE
jgi:hypothetical protein